MDTRLEIYEAKVGDRIRFLFQYGHEVKALWWLQVLKDASLYTGPRVKDPSFVGEGSVTVGKEPVEVLYQDAIPTPATHRNRRHASFHGSGAANLGSLRHYQATLRDLQEQVLVCAGLVAHPSTFDGVSHLRKRDILWDYPIDEERPVTLMIYAAPITGFVPIHADADHQRIAVIEYPPEGEFKGLTVAFDCAHGAPGPWPPYSYVIARGGHSPEEPTVQS